MVRAGGFHGERLAGLREFEYRRFWGYGGKEEGGMKNEEGCIIFVRVLVVEVPTEIEDESRLLGRTVTSQMDHLALGIE
jgi:hypothetical protein